MHTKLMQQAVNPEDMRVAEESQSLLKLPLGRIDTQALWGITLRFISNDTNLWFRRIHTNNLPSGLVIRCRVL